MLKGSFTENLALSLNVTEEARMLHLISKSLWWLRLKPKHLFCEQNRPQCSLFGGHGNRNE